MVPALKKYTVSVHGESFTIVSDEPELVIAQAIAHLEERAKSVSSGLMSPHDFNKMAILIALEVARDYVQAKMQLDVLHETQLRVLSHIEHETGI